MKTFVRIMCGINLLDSKNGYVLWLDGLQEMKRFLTAIVMIRRMTICMIYCQRVTMKTIAIKKSRKQSYLEKIMELQLLGTLVEEWQVEYKFLSDRNFRFDFAWPEKKIALEVEGGTWTISRHTTGKGFEADCLKYNLAAVEGWRIIRATSEHVKTGSALVWLEAILNK